MSEYHITCNSLSVWWFGNFLLLQTGGKLPNLISKWDAIHSVKRATCRLFRKIILYNKSDYRTIAKRDENPGWTVNSAAVFSLGRWWAQIAAAEVVCCLHFEGRADETGRKIACGVCKKKKHQYSSSHFGLKTERKRLSLTEMGGAWEGHVGNGQPNLNILMLKHLLN